MAVQPYLFSVAEARSFSHPIFESITKHTFLMRACDLPTGLPTGANARDPVGMNRRVYRDVAESLRTNEALPGSFDLMNLGITIIADRVEMSDKRVFQVFVDDEDGIVNGAHTARIIEQCQADDSVPTDQYVEVRIITGLDRAPERLKADIAKGQNTGIAVRPESIYDTQGIFDPLRALTTGQPWEDRVAWRESDTGEYDVRDFTSVLEAMNVIEFHGETERHPVHAYEKWSTGLRKYAVDAQKHAAAPEKRLYAALEPLLLDALQLYDQIRHDFYPVLLEHVSKGGAKFRIIESGDFEFPLAGLPKAKHRLTKGATYPIFAAFRNCVDYDESGHTASWRGGFNSVLELWASIAPDLVRETVEATRDIGRTPDMLGKNRSHWANLHRMVQNRVLRQALRAAEA